jgi:phosphoribosyl 1,2-cyclic phosphodiesterase
MLGFCPLASGSRGNCIYLGTPKTKILIDAGLSGRATKTKLAEIGVDIADIDAILITHEHSDHITGLKILAYKMGIPVFANQGTAQAICEIFHEAPKLKIFSTGETFEFQDLLIHPFTIQHDTLDPVAFTFQIDKLKLGFCTDVGFVTNLIKHQLKGCDYLYIESNHQPSMVYASPRPMVYKQRTLSRSGHLSNDECAQLVKEVYHPNLKHIHLAHLSEECNHPQMALETVQCALPQGATTEISIATQRTISKPVLF